MSVLEELAGTELLVQELALFQTVLILFHVKTGAGLIVIVKVWALLVPKGLVAV
jgi:hypothetical protein